MYLTSSVTNVAVLPSVRKDMDVN